MSAFPSTIITPKQVEKASRLAIVTGDQIIVDGKSYQISSDFADFAAESTLYATDDACIAFKNHEIRTSTGEYAILNKIKSIILVFNNGYFWISTSAGITHFSNTLGVLARHSSETQICGEWSFKGRKLHYREMSLLMPSTIRTLESCNSFRTIVVLENGVRLPVETGDNGLNISSTWGGFSTGNPRCITKIGFIERIVENNTWTVKFPCGNKQTCNEYPEIDYDGNVWAGSSLVTPTAIYKFKNCESPQGQWIHERVDSVLYIRNIHSVNRYVCSALSMIYYRGNVAAVYVPISIGTSGSWCLDYEIKYELEDEIIVDPKEFVANLSNLKNTEQSMTDEFDFLQHIKDIDRHGTLADYVKKNRHLGKAEFLRDLIKISKDVLVLNEICGSVE